MVELDIVRLRALGALARLLDVSRGLPGELVYRQLYTYVYMYVMNTYTTIIMIIYTYIYSCS